MYIFAADGILGLPEHFGADMLAVALFGVALVMLVSFGCKFCDWVWRKLDLEEQVQKGNIAAGIVMGSLVIGLCYALATVVAAILG